MCVVLVGSVCEGEHVIGSQILKILAFFVVLPFNFL